MSHITSVGVSQDRRDLADRIRQRQEDLRLYEEQHAILLRENEQLQQKKEELIQELLISEGHEELLATLERVRVLAGFTEVSGPGIILTLDDKPGFKIGDNEDSIVHDTDLKHALDILLGAGAAAFSINGNRLVNASDLKCIGLTIRCNQQRLSPPYVILALGDPIRLSEAIEHDQTFNFRQMPGIDLIVRAQKSDRIVIPAYAESDNIERFIDMLEVVSP
ncbi:MAG: DUF881 domain-containing protein [Saccharofermentanales bacterium]|nr:DUF881 domain-containing protein [Clostridiaceae bacterium]